eukprot:3105938-Rhodomonas_salina.3
MVQGGTLNRSDDGFEPPIWDRISLILTSPMVLLARVDALAGDALAVSDFREEAWRIVGDPGGSHEIDTDYFQNTVKKSDPGKIPAIILFAVSGPDEHCCCQAITFGILNRRQTGSRATGWSLELRRTSSIALHAQGFRVTCQFANELA